MGHLVLSDPAMHLWRVRIVMIFVAMLIVRLKNRAEPYWFWNGASMSILSRGLAF